MQPGQGPQGWGQPPPGAGYPPPPAGYPTNSYGSNGAGPSTYQPYGAAPPPSAMGYTADGKGHDPHKPAGYPGAAPWQQQQPHPPQQQQEWAAPAPQRPPESMDVESGMSSAMAFAETAVRNGFVRKVFGIVTIQLLVTVAFSVACLYVPSIKNYMMANQWPFWLAWGLTIVLLFTLMCVGKARRTYPLNMILLGLFTLAEAFLIGMITSRYAIEVVLIAFLVTAVAVGALTLFAINTKIDVTKWGSMLMVAGFVLLALVLVGIFWVNKIVYLVIAGVSALLFSAYLIYDIQMLMGGRTYSISPDEYVFAALSIYLDIINIFLALLQIIGFASNN